MADQPLAVERWQDIAYPVDMAPATDVTGWTVEWLLKLAPGDASPVVLRLTATDGIALVDATAGKWTVTLSSARTGLLAGGRVYVWEFWRTDDGSRKPLAVGTLSVTESVWEP